MKTCFKCKREMPISEFYKHKQLLDGHLNKCKECTKKDVTSRYYDPKFREVVIAYERSRTQTEHRKQKRLEYQRKMRLTSPEKYKARQAVSNALRYKKIIKCPCVACGSKEVEAHHTDYSKPLNVMWLCRKHHMIIENKIPF